MTPDRPEVTVVVPTRDREARLRALLDSLEGQSLPHESFEVVVVDDGSTDGTRALLEERAGRGTIALRFVTLAGSRGPAVARNEGWRSGRAPTVAFTDDDCEATPTWLEHGLRAARSAPGAAVQGRTEPIPRERHLRGPFVRTLDIRRSGPFYETCNMFYPRALLDRLGGFDERSARPVVEDTDLAWRAIEAGVEIRYADDALVWHAVQDLGPAGHLSLALRWSDGVWILRRHPGLREAALQRGIFWKRSHALFLQAALGVGLARFARPAALLAYPYARDLMARCRAAGASPALAGYYLAFDLLEVLGAVRGAARSRVLVL